MRETDDEEKERDENEKITLEEAGIGWADRDIRRSGDHQPELWYSSAQLLFLASDARVRSRSASASASSPLREVTPLPPGRFSPWPSPLALVNGRSPPPKIPEADRCPSIRRLV